MDKVETTIVPIRLTPTEIEELDRLVRCHNFDSRSGVLRAGLGKMMEVFCILPQTDRQIEEERKVCRPRRATVRHRHVVDLRSEIAAKPEAEAKVSRKRKTRKQGVSKVASGGRKRS